MVTDHEQWGHFIAPHLLCFGKFVCFESHVPRTICIHIRCQELGSDTVISCLLFLFKDLGSSFPGLELQTFQMNGKRSTNWTVAVIYALRTTKPVHKYHRSYKNLARETISPRIMVETVIINARWLYIYACTPKFNFICPNITVWNLRSSQKFLNYRTSWTLI